MQPRVANQAASSSRFDVQTDPAPPTAPVAAVEPVAGVVEGVIEPGRSREELNMLLIGFGTGLTVGFIFLIYLVISFSGWLP